jgi:AcrR family transcriptional regulator
MNQDDEPCRRSTADSRRNDLMKAAFDIVAAQGFEGLRTRLVAEKAGVNIATLHYYFPTKEALIWALAEYIGGIFATTHAPSAQSTGRYGLDRLRQEFADSAYYMSDHPDLIAVMAEFGQRAGRDEVVGRIRSSMFTHWRLSVAETVSVGLADGSFRTDLDSEQITTTLIAVFSGLFVVGVDGVDTVRSAIENWLVVPQGNKEQE